MRWPLTEGISKYVVQYFTLSFVFCTLQQYVPALVFSKNWKVQDIVCSLCLPGGAQLYSTAFQWWCSNTSELEDTKGEKYTGLVHVCLDVLTFIFFFPSLHSIAQCLWLPVKSIL